MGRWAEVPLDDRRMRCYLAQPRAVHGPGVLVCMHGPGVDEFIRDICERLAARGYAAIAPDLYHRQPEPRVAPWTNISDVDASRDMAEAVLALGTLAGADTRRVGVVGFCMGGRLAFLCAPPIPSAGLLQFAVTLIIQEEEK